MPDDDFEQLQRARVDSLGVEDARTIEPGDRDYPTGLLAAEKPPTLRVAGPWRLGKRVAVVGTREATEDALAFTRGMCRELSTGGVTIWSGGALGIDSAAHVGGLEGAGSTVVVLPSGLDYRYPKKNHALFDRVLTDGGTLISPYKDPDKPDQGSFFYRNTILAACVPGLIVVQCPIGSGARNAAGAARAYSKRIGVVPQAPWEPAGTGCVLELRLGAAPITCANDVLDLLGLPRPSPSPQTLLFSPDPVSLLPADERPIAAAIQGGARHVDAICEALSVPAGEVTRKLLSLVLRGAVIERPDGLALASGPRTRHPPG